jgi:hypothetical protein
MGRLRALRGLTVAACAVVALLVAASSAAAAPRLTLTANGVP